MNNRQKKLHQAYNVTKPNEQHQFDLFYMPHNFFEGNTYTYILTSIDVAPTYNAPGLSGQKIKRSCICIASNV